MFKENTEEEMPLLGGVLHVVDSEVSKVGLSDACEA